MKTKLRAKTFHPHTELVCRCHPQQKQHRRMTVFIGVIVLLLGLLIVGDIIWRKLHPPRPEVVNLCDPADKTLSAQAAKQCRWVIPAKYVSVRLDKSDEPFFEARVPWIDIDPTYPLDPKHKVTFQFWPSHSRYASGIRWKNEHIGTTEPDEQGLLWLWRRQNIYFEGFDGDEVYVFSAPSFSSIQPTARIYRPLSPSGDMHWIVHFPPKLESQEAMDSYVQHNIKEIDRKLIRFISQWH